MRYTQKLLLAFAVCGAASLAASSVFAAQPQNESSKRHKVEFLSVTGESVKPNVYPGNKPVSPQKSDSDIRKGVRQAVEPYKDVAVAVDEGVVTLSGQVVSATERNAAISAARDVVGVRTVQDQIQVAGAGSQSVGEYVDDAAITTAVKSKFVTESGLSNFKISVDTIDGVVTLTGNVKSKELADRAGTLAAQVKGVKRVDNKLLVKP